MPKTHNPYAVKAAADGKNTISIIGDIGGAWWDDESVNAKTVVESIAGMSGDIDVDINSYGGSVADGMAIHNAFVSHPGTVTTRVTATAYSIANMIAQGANPGRRFVASASLGMVHAPWGATVGNAQDHRDQAETLDKYAVAMKTAYTRHGISDESIDGWLSGDKDHFFTAEESLEVGLADEITEPVAMAIAMARGFDIDRKPTLAKSITIKVDAGDTKSSIIAIASELIAKAKQEIHMADRQNHPAQGAENKALTDADVIDIQAAAGQKALKVEAKRVADITLSFGLPGVRDLPGIDALRASAIGDQAITPAMANAQVLELMGKASGGPVTDGSSAPQAGVDALDKFAVGAKSALLVKAGLMKRDDKAMRGNEFAGYSMMELARTSLVRANIDASGSKMDMIGLALSGSAIYAAGHHSTSDFGNILMDVANKAMLRGWEETGETFQEWTNTGTLSDFKPSHRVDLNLFPGLPEVPEGAEYSYGSMTDRGEQIVLLTYGKLFSITRQAIINDDLSAFTRIPGKMGRAAMRTLGDLVYAVLTGNPLMSDGTALFHADHGNLLTGSALDTAGVSAMRTAMALQKDPDGHATALNIPLRRLLVPVALEDAALTVRDSEYVVGSADEPSRVPNSQRGRFEITADARLDVNSSTAWYGASSTQFDLIEVAYLDGNNRPFLEQKNGWNVDGGEFKVRIDAGVAPLDFRALSKNPGA